MKRLTHEEFVRRVRKLKGDEYEILSEYHLATSPIRIKHIKCGRIFETTPDKFYNGGCIKCGYLKMKSKQRKTPDQFLKEVEIQSGGEYHFIDRYVNNTTGLRVKHLVCDHVYKVIPRDFLSGRRCPNCKNKRISEGVTKTHSLYNEQFKKLVGAEYDVIDEYKAARYKITVRHNKCGLHYKVLPNKFLSGNRCPVCVFKELGEKNSLSLEVFKQRVFELVGAEFSVLGDYKNNRTKTRMRHNECGFEWEVQPDSFLSGNRCPCCKESKGEKKVAEYLKKEKYTFERQYVISECKYKSPLRFDFAVFNNNSELIALIEYQGIQHYKPISVFGGRASYECQLERDGIKRNFCDAERIPLIEIAYNVEDITHYLNSHLSKLNHSV